MFSKEKEILGELTPLKFVERNRRDSGPYPAKSHGISPDFQRDSDKAIRRYHHIYLFL